MYQNPMLKEGSLLDKVIVVTGGGSGLGKAMTRYFLDLGAKVVITSRNMERLEQAKIELEKKTGGIVLPGAAIGVAEQALAEKVPAAMPALRDLFSVRPA